MDPLLFQTVKVGLLSSNLGYDLTVHPRGFNYRGLGTLEATTKALIEFGNFFCDYRGPQFPEFYEMLKEVITNKFSPYLLPTIKTIKKKIEGEFFPERHECYRKQLEQLYGLPVEDVVTKENRAFISAKALENGGLLSFKTNRLGLHVPLIYFMGSDLAIHCIKLRTKNPEDRKDLCEHVKRFKHLKRLLFDITLHCRISLSIGIPSIEQDSSRSLNIHPFLRFEHQSCLSSLPPTFQDLLKPYLSFNAANTLPTLTHLINTAQKKFVLQMPGSNAPGFYLRYEEGQLFLTRGDWRIPLFKGFPEMIDEIERTFNFHRISVEEKVKNLFVNQRRDECIKFDCGPDGNIIFNYLNFDHQVIEEVLNDVPSWTYVSDKLEASRIRKRVEDCQKQADAIPFTIGFPKNPEEMPYQLFIHFDRMVNICYLSFGFAGYSLWTQVESSIERFPQRLRKAYEEMNENYEMFTNQFNTTNSCSQSKGIPEAQPGCEPEELLKIFQEINFSDPAEEGYLDPKVLTKEGQRTTVETLAISLIFFVYRLNLDRHIEWDAVPGDPEEQKQFKLKLRAYLSHIIFALKSESNLNIRNDMVYQIAESGDLCGRRWQNIVQHVYRQIVLKTIATSDNVEQFLLECADQMKLNILEDMLMKSGNDQSAHERSTFMEVLSMNGIELPGQEAFESEDPFYRQAFKGKYKDANEVMVEFVKEYRVSSFYEVIQHNLEQKIRESQSRFLANLLNVIAQQIIDEMGAEPAFIAADLAYGLRRKHIFSEFSEEALSEGISLLENMTDTNKRVRKDSELTETAKRKQLIFEEIATELKTTLAEIALGEGAQPKTRLQRLKLRAIEESKQKAVKDAQMKYQAAMEAAKQELVCQAAQSRQQRKEQLAYQIAKERNYFEYDQDDLPTMMTKAGIRFMLLKFNLIEKNPKLMQN